MRSTTPKMLQLMFELDLKKPKYAKNAHLVK